MNKFVLDCSELDINNSVLDNYLLETTAGEISFEDNAISSINVIEGAELEQLRW